MVDVVVLVTRVGQESLEFEAELVGHSQVQRPEIGAKGLVDQVFIDAEEEGIRLVPGRLSVADPEEPICLYLTTNDFDSGRHGLNMYSKTRTVLNLANPLIYKFTSQ